MHLKLNFMQMICALTRENHTELKKTLLIPPKMIIGFLILACFGGTPVTCNKDIPYCDERLNELKKDVQDWQKRCLNETRYDINSVHCKTEKEYLQERMRMQTEMCFYSGKKSLIVTISYLNLRKSQG